MKDDDDSQDSTLAENRETGSRETPHNQTQDAYDANALTQESAWTADSPSSDSAKADPFSAQAEQSSYPEAGSPYAPPGPAASAYGQSSYRQPQYGQAQNDPARYGPTHYGQGSYGQPAGQSGHAQPANGAVGAHAPLSDQNERNLALAAHLGALGGAVFSGGSLGWLVPLVLYLMYKDRSPYIRTHAAASLNFQIAVIIAVIVSIPLMFVLIGFFTIIAAGLAALIFPIIAAVAASDGRPYRYPLTPPMVK